jgi:multidrug resistance efflux pump
MDDTKRWLIRGTLVLLLGVGAAAAIKLPARATAVAEGVAPAPAEVVAPGLVAGATEVLALGFETSGRLDEVLVKEGERVVAGQLLARLDDRLARARLASAEAAVAVARARRDAALHGSRQDELRAAQAEADAARADARKQQVTRDRGERLLVAGAITADEMDRTRGSAEAAAAQAEAAAARLALVQQGPRLEQRREAIAAVAAADAELAAARVLVSQTELSAPAAGVILRRQVEPGERVVMLPPTVVMTLCDLDHLRLRAEVDEADVGRVTLGQRAYATAEAYPSRRFPAQVTQIMHALGRKSAAADDPRAKVDTRVLEVILRLDGDPALPLGLRVDVHLL